MQQDDLLDVPHLIYIMDPMCSWCYGFAPILRSLKEGQEGKLKFKLVVGGLRPGTTAVMDHETKQTMKQHWRDVELVSEQPFDYAFMDREGFKYDTEPACRAVVTVRYLKPEAEHAMAEELQTAFYAKNNDITNADVLATVALKFGIAEDVFLEKFNSEEMVEKTKQDFIIARHLQATAFPSLYLLDGTNISLICRGYRLKDALESRINEALNRSNTP